MGLPTQTPEQLLRIQFVRVFVRDQELSLRFYLDQLGFRLSNGCDLNHVATVDFLLVGIPILYLLYRFSSLSSHATHSATMATDNQNKSSVLMK